MNLEEEEIIRKKLISLAQAMLNGNLGLIEGATAIYHTGWGLSGPDEGVLLPFVGVASETDIFPQDEYRFQYAAEYLKRLDKEKSEYLAKRREFIKTACNELILTFTQTLDEIHRSPFEWTKKAKKLN